MYRLYEMRSAVKIPNGSRGQSQVQASDHPAERRFRSILRSPTGCSPDSEAPLTYFYNQQTAGIHYPDTNGLNRSDIRCNL